MKKIEPLIAHRGASAYAPENTLVAFDEARLLGARCIEFDVMMCKDGELFVFHDDKLTRTSNGKGDFHDATSEYILRLDAGSWFSPRFVGEKIPSFSEVLQWLIRHRLQAN